MKCIEGKRIIDTAVAQNEINSILSSRDLSPFSMPQNWRDPAFDSLSLKHLHTVSKTLYLNSSATLGGIRMRLQIEPASADQSSFEHNTSRFNVDLSNIRDGFHQLRLGKINYIEHILSLFPGLGFVANIRVTDPSLPSGKDGLGDLLDTIKNHLVPIGEKKLCTIREPLLIQRSNNSQSYILVLPDNGEKKLILDHQFDHPADCLGTQRIITTVEPGAFAFLARARTISYGYRTQLLRLFGGNVPFTSLSKENVLVADKNRLLNKKSRFDDPSGINREAILHELVDKLAIFGLLQRPFVGKLITRASSHADDLFAARKIAQFLEKND